MSFFILFFMAFPNLALANKNKIKFDPQLKQAYLKLLNQASDFHKAIMLKDKNQIQKEIRETQEIIAGLYITSTTMQEFHFRIHSHKLLKAIEEQLTKMSQSPPIERISRKKSNKKNFSILFLNWLRFMI